ncbi:glutamate 5-kinase [Hypericibacter adhaerens]|jgi:glutamate 5-kinase|uniref:Glutamate 5-kinase n=1 Tax=Hypericibacter adhaerens TaxID=2602016 RepID=A0A5J6N4B2_9PROT|nr:glutamate 5-kinase [Hypericibacter adhaerens]QEX24681.1 glutamate 5-kinase [Hypericibacter adhaerens]
MNGTRTKSGLAQSKRLVVKIGSALLVDEKTGAIRRQWLDALADDVAEIRQAGTEVLLVSSGAIAVGRRHLGLLDGALKLEEKQAAAATGQARLAHAYQETLARHDITAAQVLLTLGDTEERRRHLNARSTLQTLLRFACVPVINENDTVATAEIRFGDNDRLAARVAAMVSADALVLLSDIDGLYTADPRRNPEARFIPEVTEITPEIEAMAGEALPGYSSGGMVTKLAAARVALGAGCRMAIANGRQLHPLKAIREGGPCSWFLPAATPLTARKTWIQGALKPVGKLVVDDGALKALSSGKSLLPAGVVTVEGRFERGDAVIVADAQGREVARGLSAYSAEDARRIKGHKSREIEALLGYRGRDEMIHRDDLVLSRS